MSISDITILEQASMTGRGARTYNVGAGTATINPGEPVVLNTVSGISVTAMATNSPTVGSDYFVGIASTTSTQTSGTAGIVGVYPQDKNMTLLISPNSAAAFDTQAEYDALVGKNVFLDKTTGTYTILATNVANAGCVIQALNILEHPGKVAFAVRDSASNLR